MLIFKFVSELETDSLVIRYFDPYYKGLCNNYQEGGPKTRGGGGGP